MKVSIKIGFLPIGDGKVLQLVCRDYVFFIAFLRISAVLMNIKINYSLIKVLLGPNKKT